MEVSQIYNDGFKVGRKDNTFLCWTPDEVSILVAKLASSRYQSESLVGFHNE